ncbi:MAG: hypothetical protein U1E76_14880 [Planctomycetota bacterium]
MRSKLLGLHQALLDGERREYERAHGRISNAQLFELVVGDGRFAWLRALSELVARIDERLEALEPLTGDEARALLAATRALLTPSETGSAFARRYHTALQRQPDVVMAHADIVRELGH